MLEMIETRLLAEGAEPLNKKQLQLISSLVDAVEKRYLAENLEQTAVRGNRNLQALRVELKACMDTLVTGELPGEEDPCLFHKVRAITERKKMITS